MEEAERVGAGGMMSDLKRERGRWSVGLIEARVGEAVLVSGILVSPVMRGER